MNLPTALYVHIPFCIQRCYYCDFNSSLYNQAVASRYLEALGRELEEVKAYPLKTVYIGGGTPTALKEVQLKKLIALLTCTLNLGVEEYTIEANPGTLSPGKLAILKEGGVNRISLGAQSFRERGLRLLGRIHSPEDTLKAFSLLRKWGFDNISIDLIFGWPGQTIKEWEEDLLEAMTLDPEHISTYCLTVERGTALSRQIRTGKLPRPQEDLQLQMLKKAILLLTRQGYRHYEISNFAKRGKECRHNINYWKNRPYVGIGAGAFSYLEGRRSSNTKDILGYIEKIERSGRVKTFSETLPPKKRAAETLIMALRMTSGIREEEYSRLTGYSLRELYGKEIDKICSTGLMSFKGGRLRLTRPGLFVSNSIMVEFI
ncbi:MAG TPA: radical SAM family heme chaperone HemW [Candidatus Hypogeohydataceae bacterium YC38]